MYRGVAVLLAAVFLGIGNAAVAQQGGVQSGGNPGGMASENMSDQGKQNANAQWSGGATKGQGRSDLRNSDHQGHGQNHGQHHAKGHSKSHGEDNGHGKGHGKHK